MLYRKGCDNPARVRPNEEVAPSWVTVCDPMKRLHQVGEHRVIDFFQRFCFNISYWIPEWEAANMTIARDISILSDAAFADRGVAVFSSIRSLRLTGLLLEEGLNA